MNKYTNVSHLVFIPIIMPHCVGDLGLMILRPNCQVMVSGFY